MNLKHFKIKNPLTPCCASVIRVPYLVRLPAWLLFPCWYSCLFFLRADGTCTLSLMGASLLLPSAILKQCSASASLLQPGRTQEGKRKMINKQDQQSSDRSRKPHIFVWRGLEQLRVKSQLLVLLFFYYWLFTGIIS